MGVLHQGNGRQWCVLSFNPSASKTFTYLLSRAKPGPAPSTSYALPLPIISAISSVPNIVLDDAGVLGR